MIGANGTIVNYAMEQRFTCHMQPSNVGVRLADTGHTHTHRQVLTRLSLPISPANKASAGLK